MKLKTIFIVGLVSMIFALIFGFFNEFTEDMLRYKLGAWYFNNIMIFFVLFMMFFYHNIAFDRVLFRLNLIDRLLTEPKLYCKYCNKKKIWEEFHFGTSDETTPLICISCLQKDKVKRTFKKY